MQYSIEEYRHANLPEWQSFMDHSPYSNIFQTTHWAKAMQEAGLNVLLEVARDGSGNIRGGMLATYNRFSFYRMGTIPNISVMGGPVVYDTSDKQLLEETFTAFDRRARKLKALNSFVRSFFPLDEILTKRLSYVVEYDRLPCTVILDLAETTQNLWKNMAKRARWGIRKAEKAGINVEEGKTLDAISLYYQIHVSTCRRLKIPLTSFQMFSSIWKNFSHTRNIRLFLARHDGNPIAGCIVLVWHDKMWYWHSDSLQEYWHLNPNHMLQWHVIRWGAENHIKSYDLLGIPCNANEKHPKHGLYLFKTQFGGRIEKHGEYIKHYSPLRSLLLTRILQPTYVRISSMKRTSE